MKKLFISQPMRDKTDEQILAERERAIKSAKEHLGEEVEVIDSFFQRSTTRCKTFMVFSKIIRIACNG